MKVYLDSGVFIDYLIGRGHTISYLRSTKRRGRDPERLRADAEECLASIRDRHDGATSSLTCWEVEEAIYGELARRSLAGPSEGVSSVRRFFIPAARDVVTQTLIAIDFFGIRLVDLTRTVVIAQCGNLELQQRGIRAADALHVTTALAEGAKLLITTDSELIRLDNVFETSGGVSLRCLDTDQAKVLLT